MVDYTLKDLAEDIGTSTADGLRNIANTAADFYCNVWSKNPFALWGNELGNPLTQAGTALSSRLCAPRNLEPAPPVVPFSGGRCPIRYIVTGTFKFATGSPGNYSLFNILGPIQGIGYKTFPGGAAAWGVQAAPDLPGNPDGFHGVASATPSEILGGYARIGSVTPQSGADVCGDPGPQYEIQPIVDVDFSAPVSVNISNDVAITVPVVIAPVIIRPTLDFRPQIQVKVGPFTVAIDGGGVTITNDYGVDNDFILPPPSTRPDLNPPTPRLPVGDCAECDLDPVLTQLSIIKDLAEDIKECACGPETVLTASLLGSGDSGTFVLPLRTRHVRVLVTSVGDQVRSQSGNANSPEVLFLGWYAFGNGNGFGDRNPISYQASLFLRPGDMSRFTFALVFGSTAEVVAYYEEDVE